MFCFKHQKLFYVTIVLLLEATTLANSITMDSKRSFILVEQNTDDFKSLELCTSRNQQKLGSVFGNFTRHHKKGHRSKTTTTSTEATKTLTHTDKYNTTSVHPKSPNFLRLSALENDYNDSVYIGIKNISRLRHHPKKIALNEEVVAELEEKSIVYNLNKVKKKYNDNAFGMNKLNSGKGSTFLTDNCTTVVAQIGTTAVLHCEVSDITENTVTWIRKKDYSLLSVGLVTYSADSRFFSAHGRHVKDWALHIRFATSNDAGYYECQVPTHPPTSIFFKLVLVAAYAEIIGESEKIIHEGSMLRLICVVKRSTEPPSYVFWYFEDRMINYDLNGVTVHNGRQTSELVIGAAAARHAGNYTCLPANAKAASVTVHVVQSETPAAMQHGNNSASSERVHFLVQVMTLISVFIVIYHEHG